MFIENTGPWGERAALQPPSSYRALESDTAPEAKNVELVGQVGDANGSGLPVYMRPLHTIGS